MRTYAEYLGLDAQLLIEEYRVDYEPRGEGDLQPMVSRPSKRQQERRRPRASRGPPGPGTAIVVVVVVILAIFVVLGLTGGNSGSGGGAGSNTTTQAKNKKKPARSKRKHAAKPKPTSVRLHVVPISPTYLCVDRGLGTSVLYQGTASSPQTFRGRRLRLNVGNASTVRVFNNGKRVPLPSGATIVGYQFTPTRSKPLASGVTRPCA